MSLQEQREASVRSSAEPEVLFVSLLVVAISREFSSLRDKRLLLTDFQLLAGGRTESLQTEFGLVVEGMRQVVVAQRDLLSTNP